MTNKQAKVWNGPVGEAWVEHANDFDKTLEPFGRAAMSRLEVAGRRVLDVGCGTGATTIALAALAHPATVTGVDLSAPMLAEAKRRAEQLGVSNIAFVESDVEATAIGSGLYDVAFSRFGVMFFADPVVAFTHIRESLTDGGQLGFVCFQSPAQNPFIMTPVSAAAAYLRMPPPAAPNAPSPFAFADRDRTESILRDAGFRNITIEAGPTEAVLGDNVDDLQHLARRLLEQNPAAAVAFGAATDSDRNAAVTAAATALEPHRVAGRVVLGAATWIVTASALHSST